MKKFSPSFFTKVYTLRKRGEILRKLAALSPRGRFINTNAIREIEMTDIPFYEAVDVGYYCWEHEWKAEMKHIGNEHYHIKFRF